MVNYVRCCKSCCKVAKEWSSVIYPHIRESSLRFLQPLSVVRK